MPVLMKELRTHLKLSLNKFAAPLEISSGYIKRVEDGRTVPSQKVLDSICAIYSVDPFYFQDNISLESAVGRPKTKEEINSEGGLRVKDIRQERGMMLVELARVSGITEGQSSCIENRGYTLTVRNAKTIGRVLEVGEDWLLTGDDRNKYHPVNDELIEFLKDKFKNAEKTTVILEEN